MLDDFDRWRGRQLNHLAVVVHALSAQLIVAVGAAIQGMTDGACGLLALTRLVMARGALLARRFRLGVGGFVRLDKGWRIAPFLFEFDVLGPQAVALFIKHHGHKYTTLVGEV
ncbi:MAG: hypothetical protein C0183_02585 [Roseiflexus castenholzii]|nr:MAG: hypothetical protein C0183_02585 [Roseiflexus castenholzii]